MGKFKKGDFVFCITGSKKYKILDRDFEEGYEYFKLYNLKTGEIENLLVDFVEQKFHKLHLGIIAKFI